MDLAGLAPFLAHQPLLAIALAAILVSVAGGMLRRAAPRFGGFLRAIGNLGLLAAFLLTCAQLARLTTGADVALPGFGLPRQEVAGEETRVAMANDGHFWVTAEVDGVRGRFLVDTGATVTALSAEYARSAGIRFRPFGQTVMMNTANGTVEAELGTVRELRFGNVVARDLDVIVAPGMGANVIGMNLLTRLASWRVEGGTLILVPHHPQDANVS